MKIRDRGTIKALLEAAAEERDGAIQLLVLLFFAGMRLGEALGLKRQDIDFERRLVKVRNTKSGTIRHIPISDALLPILQELPARPPDSWVFPGRTERMRLSTAHRLLQRCAKRARLIGAPDSPYEHITFHDLRHSFASNWMKDGGNIQHLQQMMGHRGPPTPPKDEKPVTTP